MDNFTRDAPVGRRPLRAKMTRLDVNRDVDSIRSAFVFLDETNANDPVIPAH